MQIKADELLEKLDALNKKRQETTKEMEELLSKQVSVLDSLLIDLEPVYEWYHNERYMFTHPYLEFRSDNGPILGFDEKDNSVIFFNIEKKFIEKVNIYDNDERKRLGTYQLVRQGYFKDAVSGLKYLNNMLENYIERNNKSISKLKQELEEF